MKRTAAVCVLTVALCFTYRPALADAYERGRPWRSEQPWEKLSVTFGFFLTNFTSDVSLTGAGAGVVLNLEDLLGLDTTTAQFRLNADYRAWRRHHFHFSYYDLSRKADKTLTISIPEEEIEAGALAESHLDITIYKAGYSYSFWNDDRLDLEVGLGFYVMELGAGLNVFAEGSAGGQQGSIAEEVIAEDTTLPLPVLGFRGAFAITKRVFLKQSIEFFYITLSDFDGLLIDFNLALEGHICRFFGLGAGFNFLRVDIEGNGGSDFLGGGWDGKLNFDYGGLFLYGKFFF